MTTEEDRRSFLSVEIDGVRSTSRLGNIARGAVGLALHSLGKCVLLPLNEDQRYDWSSTRATDFFECRASWAD